MTAAAPAAAPAATDQEELEQGLAAFANWIRNAGTSLLGEFGLAGDLPYSGFSFEELLNRSGISALEQKISDEINAQITSVITSAFSGGDTTTQAIIDHSDQLTHTFTSELREFHASVDLADITHDLVLDLSGTAFGEFGVEVKQSTPIELILELDLDFVFGLASDDTFYVEDPTVFARLKLDHAAPLDLSVGLGPLGMGIDDGTLKFEVGLGLGTDGRLNIDTLNSDIEGSLLGAPSLASDIGFHIYLPFQLEGALAGLQSEPSIVQGFYSSEAGDGSGDLSAFFGALATTLGSADMGQLFGFQHVSLDVLLDGLIAVFDELVGSDSLAYKPLPVVNKSLVEILGSNSGNVMTRIRNALETVRNTLDDMRSFEVDVNFAIDDELGIANDFGEKTALKSAIATLTSVASELNGLSSDSDLELALAGTDAYEVAFADLRTARNVRAAINYLMSIDATLNGTSSDDAIAVVLANLTDPSAFQDLLDDRATLVANAKFVSANSLLQSLGFDRSVTESDIVTALRTDPTERAKAARDILLQGTTPDALIIARSGAILVDTSASTTAPTDSGSMPTRNEVIARVAAADLSAALDAFETLQAIFLLADAGLDSQASDDEINSAPAFGGDADLISGAFAARDQLYEPVALAKDQLARASVVLQSQGLDTSDPSLLDDATIEAAFFNDAQVQAAIDASKDVSTTPSPIIAIAERFDALGLHANSTDQVLALTLVDIDQYNIAVNARTYLASVGVTPGSATSTFASYGLDATTYYTDSELASVFVADTFALANQLPALIAARDMLATYDANKIISLSYDDSQLFVGFNFELSGTTAFDLNELETFLKNEVQLDDKVTFNISENSIVDLQGDLKVDLSVGIDFSSLENGITFDELFVQVNNVEVSGGISTDSVTAAIGFGPMLGEVIG
ncbi:MAG: hypothetical protein JJ992_13370, partial [Planctomycetes bacterium]|nr:hypothetical protein [Planctomycetota bacterium]